MRADFVQPDPAERRDKSFKRTVERYESFYGTLDAAQRERMAALLAASPFDADRWQAERSQRNREMVQTLASTIAAARNVDRDAGLAQAPGCGAHHCRARHALTAAGLPGLPAAPGAGQLRPGRDDAQPMTPEQRQHARNKLKGWEKTCAR